MISFVILSRCSTTTTMSDSSTADRKGKANRHRRRRRRCPSCAFSFMHTTGKKEKDLRQFISLAISGLNSILSRHFLKKISPCCVYCYSNTTVPLPLYNLGIPTWCPAFSF